MVLVHHHKKFTTNASKSLYVAIKRRVDFKESQWPEFNEKMREFAESQWEELIRALSGCSQFKFCSAVSHYRVPMQVWVKMTAER